MTVLVVLESTLPPLLLVLEKIQHNEATVAVLTVLAVPAVMAVSVMTATPPLNSSPLVRDPEIRGLLEKGFCFFRKIWRF